MHVRAPAAVLGVVVIAIAGLVSSGCVDGGGWDGARQRDTVAGYYRFLRDNPGTRYEQRARERIAYLRVLSHKSIEAFEAFDRDFPNSKLLRELDAALEPLYFEHARRTNTSRAYQGFLEAYPDGALASRAEGNLMYVEVVSKEPRPGTLQAFVDQYPDSDFVSEAEHTLDLFHLRQETQIRTLGVRVEVAPNVTQPNRVRRGFAALVARQYQEIGVTVSLIAPGEGIGQGMDAWMRIDYEEPPAAGVFGGRTVISRCRVRLYHKDSEDPVWDRTFDAPADHHLKGAYGRDKTLFGNSSYRFWNSFFVPVSTWATSHSRAQRIDYLDEVSAIDVQGSRAVLLYLRGGFDLMDVSSPMKPEVLERFRREHDLSRWTGIKLLGQDLVLAYGPDGIELIELIQPDPKRLGRWEIHEVGAVRSVALYDQTLLFASSQGVYAMRLQNRPLVPHRLLEGEYVGLELAKPFIFLVRPNRVEVSSAKHLVRHLSGSRLPLGKLFGAYKARLYGRSLFVFGKETVVEVSVAVPARPKVVAKLEPEKFGNLNDMAASGQNLYLLGSHGLQISGPSGSWISDAIQIEADAGLVRKGGFAFLVGKRSLEVIDLGPYYAGIPANSR